MTEQHPTLQDDHLPRNTGFVWQVESPPTNKGDKAVLLWAMEHMLWEEEASTHIGGALLEMYELPYEQGYGFVRLWKAPYTPRWEPEPDEIADPEIEAEREAHTGWWIMYGYTDSMTNLFDTPIFATGADDHSPEFYTWEY